MTKDRLADLRKFRTEEYDHDHNDHNATDANNSVAHGETVALRVEEDEHDFMADFFAEVRGIQKIIDQIDEKVKDVRGIHTAIVAAPVADERTKGQLDDLMAEIKRSSGSIHQKLKEMERKNAELEKNNTHSADTRIRKFQHARLHRRFLDVMNDYNMQQVKYRELCRDRIHRQLAITGQSMTNEELEEKLEKGDFSVFTQGIIIEKQQAQQMLKDIEERHNDIKKLEMSIRELHEMFVEMAMIVETQGEIVDRIEYNVSRTVDYVVSGKEELGQAVVSQRKARKKKICIILIIVVVVVVIALIIALTVALR